MQSFKILFFLFILAANTPFLSLNPGLSAEENFYEKFQDSAISSAAGTPWNAERHLQLVKQAKAFRMQHSKHLMNKIYPISVEDLEKIYQNAKSDYILFFAYSSMIDKEAGAVKAISTEGAATQTLGIAFGIQRVFNREMPSATVEGGWGPLARPNDLAILNVFDKEDAVLNGVLFELPLSDLLVLSKREVGYNLIPVVVTHWQDALHDQKEPAMYIAYTFQAPDNKKGEGEHYTSPYINPIPGYFNYLQKGLNNAGADFTAMWWATTYLADQKTLVQELPYS